MGNILEQITTTLLYVFESHNVRLRDPFFCASFSLSPSPLLHPSTASAYLPSLRKGGLLGTGQERHVPHHMILVPLWS